MVVRYMKILTIIGNDFGYNPWITVRLENLINTNQKVFEKIFV